MPSLLPVSGAQRTRVQPKHNSDTYEAQHQSRLLILMISVGWEHYWHLLIQIE